MEKEFVPYELAVKLKALGFDDECFGAYHNENYLDLKSEEFDYSYAVKAPLFQQAFKWFMEKGFFVSFSTHDYNIHDFYIKWSMPDSSTLSESILSDTYDTYEEAELACLTKLIEIVEKELIKSE